MDYTIKNSSNTQTKYNSYEMKEKALVLRESYERFLADAKNFLVSESINFILQQCLEGKSDADKDYGKVLCENFVKEQGSEKIISKFSRGSLLLTELSTIIKETYKKITDNTDEKNKLSFTIKPSDKNEFYDKLSDLSVNDVSKEINQRTCKAAETFIQNNINDKLDMEEIADKTQKKISEIKVKDEEKRKMLTTEYTNMGKAKINKEIYGRNKTVYEQMIHKTTNQIIKNEELRPKFVLESGKLDMDIITEKVDVMYTFLETLNTARIHTVDESYLKELFASIK